MTDISIKDEPDLGYIFFPATHDNALGHPRFDVVMQAQPTERHFDPLSVALVVKSRTGSNNLSIHHPWSNECKHKVMAGRIIVRDRRRKEVEAFTFGADLQIISDKTQTVSVFTSPAPILHLISPQSVATDFADEVEGFLARHKAHLGREYEAHLAGIDPMLLYIACLDAVQEKFTQLPHAYTGERHHLQQWIPKEIKRLDLAGKRPFLVKTVDDLFAAPQ